MAVGLAVTAVAAAATITATVAEAAVILAPVRQRCVQALPGVAQRCGASRGRRGRRSHRLRRRRWASCARRRRRAQVYGFAGDYVYSRIAASMHAYSVQVLEAIGCAAAGVRLMRAAPKARPGIRLRW